MLFHGKHAAAGSRYYQRFLGPIVGAGIVWWFLTSAALAQLGGAAGGFNQPGGLQPGVGGQPAPSGVGITTPYYQVTGDQPLVSSVVITGNRTTPLSKVMSYLKTRKDRPFDPEMVQADVRRLAASNLFRDVRTFTRDTAEGKQVTFELFERPVIEYVKFIGNREISDRSLRKQVVMVPGDPLNRYNVEEAQRKVQDFYFEKGYTDAVVEVYEGKGESDRGVVLVISEGEKQKIWSVEFIGNTVASDARLRTFIQGKWRLYDPFRWFTGKADAETLESDEERLITYYRSLGYFQARVGREISYGPSGEWVSLAYVIDEGPRYKVRNVRFEGNQIFDDQQLAELLSLSEGEEFKQLDMNRDIKSLTDLYGGYGHIFADVKADPRFLEEPGTLDMVYRINEGDLYTVGKINVNIGGDFPHTRRNVVLNRLSVRPGDIVDLREINASKVRLRASQLFENDPAGGVQPEIVVRPPQLGDEDVSNIASRPQEPAPPRSSIRGQSPGEENVHGYPPTATPAAGSPRPQEPADTGRSSRWLPPGQMTAPAQPQKPDARVFDYFGGFSR
jgi:outer membrane protein insertion porin family